MYLSNFCSWSHIKDEVATNSAIEYINYDGGTRQALFRDERAKFSPESEEFQTLANWHFWIFSPTSVLPKTNAKYTDEKASLESFNRIKRSFNSHTQIAQGQRKHC